MQLIAKSSMIKVHVHRFDEAHGQFVDVVNQIFSDYKAGTLSQNFQSVVQQLANLLHEHFKEEEELLEQHDYPGLEKHRAEHKQIIKQLQAFQTNSKPIGSYMLLELMQFLFNVITIHTKTVDAEYGPFLNSKGVF